MKVLILAAGYGTRLYPLIKDTAKPLLPIAGRPLIDYLLDKIAVLSELNEILVVTNRKFCADFEDWARQAQPAFPVPITVVNDGTRSPDDRLGAVGDIRFIIENRHVDDDLLVLGGDNLFDYELTDFIAFSRKHAPQVSIGLYDIRNLDEAGKFGVVALDADQRVSSFEEKPEHPQSTLIAMCSYYFPRASAGKVLDYVRQSKKTDKAGDYIRWLTENGAVYGFKFVGKWYDIGSIESYQEAQEKFKD